tara:strand:- start:244 stop:450 length:207 start_codon:yes stop_codon:yes gene_type:complete
MKKTIVTLTSGNSVRSFTTEGNYALDSETGKSITINAAYKIIERLMGKGHKATTETVDSKVFNSMKLG